MIVIIGADIGLAIDTKVAKLLFLNHSQMYHAHARKIWNYIKEIKSISYKQFNI